MKFALYAGNQISYDKLFLGHFINFMTSANEN
jgi:hypothetical protein